MLKSRNRIANYDSTSNLRSASSTIATTKNEPTNTNNMSQNSRAPQLNNVSAAALRKRRSSINVYDQPSSLNSRLRQLETDMGRLDEDRAKIYDDTHSTLAHYELKLNEIQAILRSRQDNVEKYVDDMNVLLDAKSEFESQIKLLKEKHDRLQDKFTQRETSISREIKLMKNKFELMEKHRTFRAFLKKSTKDTHESNYHDDDDTISNQLDDQSIANSLMASDGGKIKLSFSNGIRFDRSTLRGINKRKRAGRKEDNGLSRFVDRLVKYPSKIFCRQGGMSHDNPDNQQQQYFNSDIGNSGAWHPIRLVTSLFRRPSSQINNKND